MPGIAPLGGAGRFGLVLEGSFAGEFIIDTGLLKELRIDGAHREGHDGGPPKWVWGLLAGLVLLALLGGASRAVCWPSAMQA